MITFNPFYMTAAVVLIYLLACVWQLITGRLHHQRDTRSLLPIDGTAQPYVWKSVKVLTKSDVEALMSSRLRPLTEEGRNRVQVMTLRETPIVDYCNDYIPCPHTDPTNRDSALSWATFWG